MHGLLDNNQLLSLVNISKAPSRCLKKAAQTQEGVGKHQSATRAGRGLARYPRDLSFGYHLGVVRTVPQSQRLWSWHQRWSAGVTYIRSAPSLYPRQSRVFSNPRLGRGLLSGRGLQSVQLRQTPPTALKAQVEVRQLPSSQKKSHEKKKRVLHSHTTQ